jgi:Fic/DOC family
MFGLRHRNIFCGLLLGLGLALSAFPILARAGEVSPECQKLFREIRREFIEGGMQLRPTAEGISGDRQEVLAAAKARFLPEEFEKFQEFYLSRFFFARSEILKDFDRIQGTPPAQNVPSLFNLNGEVPFDGYVLAREGAFKRPAGELGVDDAVATNRTLLSRKSIKSQDKRKFWEFWKKAPQNSGNELDDDLGQIRSEREYDHETLGSGHNFPRRNVYEGVHRESFDEKAFDNNNLIRRVKLDSGETVVEYTPLSAWRDYRDSLSKGLQKDLLAAERKSVAEYWEGWRKDAIENKIKGWFPQADAGEIQTAVDGLLRGEPLPEKLAAQYLETFNPVSGQDLFLQPLGFAKQVLAKDELRREVDQFTNPVNGARIIFDQAEPGTLVNKFSPEDVEKIKEVVQKGGVLDLRKNKDMAIDQPQFLDGISGEIRDLRQRVVRELMQDNYDRVHKGIAAATTPEGKIDAIADFYRRFLTIHPFLDGNGRTARIQVERLLEGAGLPPPIWTLFGEDVALSQEEMRQVLRDSVALSQQYHRDLKAVLNNGFDYRLTPTPFLSPDVFVKYANLQEIRLSPENYMVWLENRRRKGQWNNEFDGEKTPASELDAYIKWRYSLMYGIHRAPDNAIHLASPTFQRTFGELSSTEAAYQFKMNNFYQDGTIYRGVSLLSPMTDEDIVRQFAQVSDKAAGKGISVDVDGARRVIQKFNDQLLNDKASLGKIIDAHVRAQGDIFNKSGMVAFSTSPDVAKNYSLGYQTDPAFYSRIKSSLQIEARKRKAASVDTLDRVNLVPYSGVREHADFLLAGAADPESVTKVTVREVAPKQRSSGVAYSDAAFTIGRKRVAERLTFNSVQLTETDADGKTVNTTYWRIHPDGSLEKLPGRPPEAAQPVAQAVTQPPAPQTQDQHLLPPIPEPNGPKPDTQLDK